MPTFQKGNPGRPKGATNRYNTKLRDMGLEAIEKAGGVLFLAKQFKKNPAHALNWLASIQVKEVGGDGGEPIRIEVESKERRDAVVNAALGGKDDQSG